MKPVRPRCQATTKYSKVYAEWRIKQGRDLRCRNSVKGNSIYCGLHQKLKEKTMTTYYFAYWVSNTGIGGMETIKAKGPLELGEIVTLRIAQIGSTLPRGETLGYSVFDSLLYEGQITT